MFCNADIHDYSAIYSIHSNFILLVFTLNRWNDGGFRCVCVFVYYTMFKKKKKIVFTFLRYLMYIYVIIVFIWPKTMSANNNNPSNNSQDEDDLIRIFFLMIRMIIILAIDGWLFKWSFWLDIHFEYHFFLFSIINDHTYI